VIESKADVDGDLPPEFPLVDVSDPLAALSVLASRERGELPATFLGITGSTGKTCTKDFAAAVLATRRVVVASEGSFNNEVGLPLTLLRADEGTEAVVCEMGARGRGHIRRLCEVARPTVGVVTNVGVAHMELFGSPEVLRDAKAELPEALPADGVAVLNADDPVVRGYAGRTRAMVMWFGLRSDAEVRAEAVDVSPATGAASFILATPEGSAPVRLAAPGAHMVANALAAAAVGRALGIGLEDTAQGLAGARLSGSRMQLLVRADGLRVIDDAYNANPTSMAAALRAARGMAHEGRSIAVLGYMAELGPIAAEEHDRVGELVARLGIDELVVVGAEATPIAVAAEREGVEPDRIHLAGEAEQALTLLEGLVRPGDLVLVKASRVARLERVARALAGISGDGDGSLEGGS
jgi:UDP-N-acetylmuramoyl-tripeptide--D-alanyl-D-alanine ligase